MPALQTYTTWKITCRSAEDARALEHWISSRIDLERVWTESVRVSPNGVVETENVRHRLGDYFADIRILAESPVNPTSFLLMFHRLPDAGRFWKDLMVNILQEIEARPERAAIAMDSKGEMEPLTLPRV
ncbi:MAG: hypothetical protein L0Y72_17250 [Gemmataceae bacterium]|nr:hypothetical protein [Gemmataceae bacterium]MCI0740800.1 hypothetical protein [Gemmataceae bacterium]